MNRGICSILKVLDPSENVASLFTLKGGIICHKGGGGGETSQLTKSFSVC